jgi:hypothetical protein
MALGDYSADALIDTSTILLHCPVIHDGVGSQLSIRQENIPNSSDFGHTRLIDPINY